MLKVDGSLDHVPAKRAHVVALHESINQPLVNIPGYGAAPTGAFILSTRNDHGAFTVFVYLYQPQTQAALVYVSEPRSLTAEQLEDEASEAVRFVESMGFMVDDVQFGRLGVPEQEAVMERVPMFRPLRAATRPEGRPGGPEGRFGALGGVVTGRPSTGSWAPNEEMQSGGLPSGLPPAPVAERTPSSMTGSSPATVPGQGSGLPSGLPPAPAADAWGEASAPSHLELGLELDGPPVPPPPSAAPASPPPDVSPPASPSLGRGLPALGGGRGTTGSGAPAPAPRSTPPAGAESRATPADAAAVSRIGRLLGTFGILLALSAGGSTGCVSSSVNMSRAREAQLDLGHQELARSQWAEALRHFQGVLEYDGDDAAALRGAGLAYWRLERLKKAEDHLRAAVEVNEKWSEPKNDLAVVLIEQSRCGEAIELLNQVIDDVFYPTQHFAQHNLARAEACAGRHGEAVDRLQKLTAERPKFCLAYLTASEVAETGRLAEATVEACEGFRQNCEKDEEIGARIPTGVKAMCDLRKGRAYAVLGDVESARTALERCSVAKSTGQACRDALVGLPP